MKPLHPLSCCVLLACAVAVASAHTDLDAFMAQVLAHRDDNWHKLQQYVLDERQSWDLRGPAHVPLWGDRREFTWFIQDGFFVRSPLRFNGVTISERERRRYEARFLAEAKRREKKDEADAPAAAAVDSPTGLSGILSQTERPDFVSAAYFLRFKFDAGHYALVGRERVEDREVLRVEYYPSNLFSEENRREQERENRGRQDRERESTSDKDRQSDAQLMRLMNKTSRVTLWIEPASQQILKYTFDDLGWDFFPGQWLVKMDDVTATMTVGQMFPDVWLPRTVDMRAQMATASGPVEMAFAIEYYNYRQADVSATIGIPGGR
jgi:hypothetical protein